MTSDRELLDRWRADDQVAGRELFERHFHAVFRFFRSKIPDVADDLAQQTFLGCVRGKAQYRGQSSFRTYLFGIARNVLYEHLRGHRRRKAHADLGATSIADFGDARIGAATWVAERQENRLLLQALRQLPLDLQVALELHYWEDMTTAEIAEVTATPVGTVKRRLQRARGRLDALISELGESELMVRSTVDNFARWANELRGQLATKPKS
ncbi:MAG: RNA polymerase sigma factor [Myxococcales bacterium FL481]|nr:MAG: RNA polymerase sigma factor [Myxococcales bacterium FL481]